MKRYITDMWVNVLLNPTTPGSTRKVLYEDVHTAKQTDAVKSMLLRAVSNHSMSASINLLKRIFRKNAKNI